MLTTLSDVKTLLQIPTSVTSFDAVLNLVIKAVSAQIETYCNRTFGVANYTDNLPPGNSQILQLENYPLNSVASIVVQGSALSSSEYFLYSQFTPSGQIYKPDGWFGPMATRGLTFDPYAPLITIAVTYSAGYVLPGGTPVSGVADLPLDLQLAAMQMTAKVFGLSNTSNLGENLQSFKEGQTAYTWDNPAKIPSDLFQVIGGMPVQFASLLNPYRRWPAA